MQPAVRFDVKKTPQARFQNARSIIAQAYYGGDIAQVIRQGAVLPVVGDQFQVHAAGFGVEPANIKGKLADIERKDITLHRPVPQTVMGGSLPLFLKIFTEPLCIVLVL
jgi:hypothetical protein